MATFKVAHFNQQGEEIIVVFLNSSFDRLSQEEQSQTTIALQACATAAGLVGTVVPVWTVGRGFRFIAPKQWQAFFKSPNLYPTLVANINRELTCD
jgi:hypothetical protein